MSHVIPLLKNPSIHSEDNNLKGVWIAFLVKCSGPACLAASILVCQVTTPHPGISSGHLLSLQAMPSSSLPPGLCPGCALCPQRSPSCSSWRTPLHSGLLLNLFREAFPDHLLQASSAFYLFHILIFFFCAGPIISSQPIIVHCLFAALFLSVSPAARR